MNNHSPDPPCDDFAVGYGEDILVVDDNHANLVAIEAALAPLGRRLVFAQSGVEALGRLLEQDVALILLDVAMPGMDGFEVARLVRARERNRATPIIFVTGMSWQDDAIDRGYELGAFDFLVKPFRAEVLRAKARVFVELQERTFELRTAQAKAHVRELDEVRLRFEAEAMERQVRQLAESERNKDDFLAILAHELRNPLQPLQTAVELADSLPDRPMPESTRNIMRHHLRHLTRLVDDLLDVARYTARKLELRRETVSLGAIVDQAVTACRTAVNSREHAFHVHGDADAAYVNADPVRMVQIVCNLVNNAARYTPIGGTIDVTWGAEDEETFVRVADTGRGISATVLPRIFEMFVQDRVSTDGAGGLGLGLGLVKRLVELHGGSVRAESPGVGKGSTFEVRLARTRPPSSLPSSKPSTPPVQMRSLRVVICDDVADVLELVAELLRSHGHEVVVVGDGEACIRTVMDMRPDVVLIDIGLPRMSGLDVARQLRRSLRERTPRLIAMTGYGQAHDRAAAFKAGFDEHILKPATSAKLLRALYKPTQS